MREASAGKHASPAGGKTAAGKCASLRCSKANCGRAAWGSFLHTRRGRVIVATWALVVAGLAVGLGVGLGMQKEEPAAVVAAAPSVTPR
jgi:hypothetical protein